MRAAENRMCILGVMHGWSVHTPEHYAFSTLRGISTDLRIVKPYTAERAARARVQWYMVLLCADQKKSLSGAILCSVFNEPGIPIKRTVSTDMAVNFDRVVSIDSTFSWLWGHVSILKISM